MFRSCTILHAVHSDLCLAKRRQIIDVSRIQRRLDSLQTTNHQEVSQHFFVVLFHGIFEPTQNFVCYSISADTFELPNSVTRHTLNDLPCSIVDHIKSEIKTQNRQWEVLPNYLTYRRNCLPYLKMFSKCSSALDNASSLTILQTKQIST